MPTYLILHFNLTKISPYLRVLMRFVVYFVRKTKKKIHAQTVRFITRELIPFDIWAGDGYSRLS